MPKSKLKTPPVPIEQRVDVSMRVFLYRLGDLPTHEKSNALLALAEAALRQVCDMHGFPLTNNLAQMMLVRLREQPGSCVSTGKVDPPLVH